MNKTIEQEVEQMNKALPEGYRADTELGVIIVHGPSGQTRTLFTDAEESINISDAWMYIRNLRVISA